MGLIEAIFFTLIILIFLLFVMVFLLGFFMRRASIKVINIFETHGALDVNKAKTREELGITGQNFFERMVKPKDYKAQALEFLIRMGVIKVTKNEKLYLSKDTLKTLIDQKKQEKNQLEMWKFILPSKPPEV